MKFGGTLTLAVAIGLLAAAPAAAEIHVTSSGSSGSGTLRDAVTAAAPGETIVIDPGVNPVLSGEIKVDKSLTIRGQGAGATTVGGGEATRVFNVGSVVQGIAVRIEGLSIVGGRAPNGAPGANDTPTTPATSGQPGQGGGAILSAANLLELVAVELDDNVAGNGGAGGNAIFFGFLAGAGGTGGSGGAIANSGTLSIVGSTFTDNAAGTGGPAGIATSPGAIPLPAGGPGSGGAIANTGTVTIADSTFSGNEAGDGSGGGFSTAIVASPGTSGGNGGAIFSTGTLTVNGTTLDENAAGNGGIGGFSTSFGGSGGGGGSGGAIYGGGTVRITNSTFVGNEAGSGGGGGSGPSLGGIGGSGGSGGALAAALASSVTVAAATLTGNSAGAGGAGGAAAPTPGPAGLGGSGGGIQGSAIVTVRGSVLSDNSAASGPNCGGTVTSAGGNLAFPDAGGCGAFAVGDPNLDPAGLGANGGPTATIALLEGSAALDLVPASSCTAADGAPLTSDQRGAPRPQGAACDAGAYELTLPVAPPPAPPVAVSRPTPDTKITKKAKKRVRTARKRAKVVFKFTSTVAGSSFECKLDEGRFVPCRSPKRYRPKPGKHLFQVRAVADGVVDPKPATARFKVVRVDPSKAGKRKRPRAGGGKGR